MHVILLITFLFSPLCFSTEASTNNTLPSECLINSQSENCQAALKKAREREDERWNQEQEDRAQATQDKDKANMKVLCDDAQQKYDDHLEKTNEKKGENDDQFYKLEEQITDLEKKLSEEQVKVSETIDDLKQEFNRAEQRHTDERERTEEDIDSQIDNLKNTITTLTDEIQQLGENEITMYYAQKKLENERYSQCFSSALQRKDQEFQMYQTQVNSKKLVENSMQSLAKGGKTNRKQHFKQRFNHFLNFCLNNQVALLTQENQTNEVKLQQGQIKRAKEKIQGKQLELQEQITALSNKKQTEGMNKFIQTMQKIKANTKEAYQQHLVNFNTTKKQIQTERNRIKQQQAKILEQKAEKVPRELKKILAHRECNTLNLFKQVVSAYSSSTTTSSSDDTNSTSTK